MEALMAISQLGSLVSAARSVAGGIGIGSKPAPTAQPVTFATVLRQAQGNEPLAVARFIAMRDGDKNGTLSLAEMGLQPQAFALLDANGDKQVSAAEMTSALANPAVAPILRS